MIVFSDLHLRESSEEVCFRVLDKVEQMAEPCGRVVFCGDFWHLRYQVNVRLLNRVNETLARWDDKGLILDMVPGNHDQVDVSGTNALEVFEAHDHIRVWTEAGIDDAEVAHGVGPFGFIPYRKDPAELAEAIEAVMSYGPKLVFAHFGVHGAEMNSGRANREEGLALGSCPVPFILGHYHKHQTGPGWSYVGSPYQQNFGEAGNVGGVYVVDDKTCAWKRVPIDVGAPKHFIVKWDPAESEEPPPAPGGPNDRVRLDIKASQEMIVKGKFKSVLKKSGLDQAQVNVIPVAVNRSLKMELKSGETLLQAASRFAAERLTERKDLDASLGALRRWTDGSQ